MKLAIKNLNLKYEDKILLEDCDFEIESSFIQISGRNGVGKSSLLNAMYTATYSGSIKVDGIELDNKKSNSQSISFVPQTALLVEGASILYHVKLLKLDETTCVEFLNHFDKSISINAKISQLSGGQKQLANIMIGVLRSKKLLILDEPYNNLSKTNSEKLDEVLSNLSCPIIVVTHKPTKLITHNVRIERRKLVCEN